MRVIEKTIIDIMKNRENASALKLSIRDKITVSNRSLEFTSGKTVQYRLWDSVLAEFDGEQISLGVVHGQWRTRTTKSRMNAISIAFELPYIVSSGGVWYWSDGRKYQGTRIFLLGTPIVLKNGQYELYLDNSI